MRQPFVATLAIITIVAMLFSGVVLLRSCNYDKTDEYSSFHRDPTHVVTSIETKTSIELDEMWESVGWLGQEVEHGGETFHAYVETVWAVGSDKLNTYFITCYHGVRHVGTEKLTIGYWDAKKNIWRFAYATAVGQLTTIEGDVELLSVRNDDLTRPVKALKLAKEQTFSAGDEVLIGGVQPSSGPAYVCTGTIKMVNLNRPEFVTKGWAWFGFSGGPIRLRKTGEVIGYVRSGTDEHPKDASESICGDYTLVRKLLKRYALESIAK